MPVAPGADLASSRPRPLRAPRRHLDTTVLIYAVGTEHAYREPCRALVEAVDAGTVRAATTVQVIQEFAPVRSRRRDRADARRLAEDFADLLTPLLTVSERDLRAGLERWERGQGLGAFYAVLAATTHAAGATGLVSSDRPSPRCGG